MDINARLAIEAECRNLLIAFGRSLDDGDSAAAAELFAPDGVWDRQGVLVRGPEAVRAVIDQRPRGRVMRHIFTNMVIDVTDGGHAEGRAYYMVFIDEGNGASGDQIPRPLVGPERLGDYLNKFVRIGTCWRIAYNGAKRIFAVG